MLRSLVKGLAGALTLSWPLLASAAAGHLKVLTYNIAGLPEGISASHPSATIPLIGPLFASYDLALVQEDFAYGALLRQNVSLTYQSPAFVRGKRWNFGDGLSQFSSQPFTDIERVPWRACHGLVDSYFDCLTPKGFTFSRLHLADGVDVDLYNVHLDAGSDPLDVQAREAQIEQLIAAIERHSSQNAILLGGDTNIRSRHPTLFERLEGATKLVDVCSELHCPEPRRIDRVFYRDSARFVWSAQKWSIDPRFVDAKGQALSDHLPVAVELDWSAASANRAAPAAIK